MQFTDAVRKDGFYISNLYWPLNELILPQDRCPNARTFAGRVVNLWVDDSVDINWVVRCAENLCLHANRL